MNTDLYDEPREGSATLLHNIVYCSRATPGVTDADVQAIIATARRYNPAYGVTGLLVYGADVFFQWLEGPKTSIEALMANIKSGFLGLLFVMFLLLVVRPVVMHMMNRDKEAAQAAAASLQLARNADLALETSDVAEAEPIKELSAAETLEEMKAKMKEKKSNISAEMLDTANTYDDKVALIRMIVSEDSARVASVLKNMIKPS